MQNSKGEYLIELPPVCDQSAPLVYHFSFGIQVSMTTVKVTLDPETRALYDEFECLSKECFARHINAQRNANHIQVRYSFDLLTGHSIILYCIRLLSMHLLCSLDCVNLLCIQRWCPGLIWRNSSHRTSRTRARLSPIVPRHSLKIAVDCRTCCFNSSKTMKNAPCALMCSETPASPLAPMLSAWSASQL